MSTLPLLALLIGSALLGAGEAPSSTSPSMAPHQRLETFLGVAVDRPSPDLIRHLNLETGIGLCVQDVVADSPADKAGVKTGDVLVRFDDQILIHPTQLKVLVRRQAANAQVILSLRRQGAEQKLTAVLTQRPTTRDSPEEDDPFAFLRRSRTQPRIWMGPPQFSLGGGKEDMAGVSVEWKDGKAVVKSKDGTVLHELDLKELSRQDLGDPAHIVTPTFTNESELKRQIEELRQTVEELCRAMAPAHGAAQPPPPPPPPAMPTPPSRTRPPERGSL